MKNICKGLAEPAFETAKRGPEVCTKMNLNMHLKKSF